jgi:hypothetical protein
MPYEYYQSHNKSQKDGMPDGIFFIPPHQQEDKDRDQGKIIAMGHRSLINGIVEKVCPKDKHNNGNGRNNICKIAQQYLSKEDQTDG